MASFSVNDAIPYENETGIPLKQTNIGR